MCTQAKGKRGQETERGDRSLDYNAMDMIYRMTHFYFK